MTLAAANLKHAFSTRRLYRGIALFLCALVAEFATGCAEVTGVPVRLSESRAFLLLPVEVNGIATTFLLDTGSTNTVLSKEFADRIGVHGNPSDCDDPFEANAPAVVPEEQCASLNSLRVGSIRVKRNSGRILIVDLPNLCARYGEEVTGILGNTAWSSADFVLDARRPSFGISRRLGLSASHEALRLRMSDFRTYLPVEINGQTFDFLLDTGSNSSRATREIIDELGLTDSDWLELEITTIDSTETRKIPILRADVRVDQVLVPDFTFLVGKENVIGLNLLQYGELSVSTRQGRFVFRGLNGP